MPVTPNLYVQEGLTVLIAGLQLLDEGALHQRQRASLLENMRQTPDEFVNAPRRRRRVGGQVRPNLQQVQLPSRCPRADEEVLGEQETLALAFLPQGQRAQPDLAEHPPLAAGRQLDQGAWRTARMEG